MRGPFWLSPDDPHGPFPPVDYALRDPDGLLALGGDLAPERLLRAYRQGIFPWYSQGQPILWWSPDPRSVLFPDELRISRSLRKILRRRGFRVTFDEAFARVLEGCAAPRRDGPGTWITPEMRRAYQRLHHAGHAHSVETWEGQRLVGGLYGLGLGRIFFGESMFSRRPDASKVAFVHLCRQLNRWDFPLIDCQVHSAHLDRLGAVTIPRAEFVQRLEAHCDRPGPELPWRFDPDLLDDTDGLPA
jgi:leucyl/phenylalanyl-tRNA--protein transferase